MGSESSSAALRPPSSKPSATTRRRTRKSRSTCAGVRRALQRFVPLEYARRVPQDAGEEAPGEYRLVARWEVRAAVRRARLEHHFGARSQDGESDFEPGRTLLERRPRRAWKA